MSERRNPAHRLDEDGEVAGGRQDAGARAFHRVDELGQRPQGQRIERAALDASPASASVSPCPARRGKAGFRSKNRTVSLVACCAETTSRGSGELHRLEPRAAERRQRQRRDVGDDAIEFERAGSKHQGRASRGGPHRVQ
jgi:hypothetical protein